MKNVRIYPKVKKIEDSKFEELLALPLKPRDRDIIKSFKNAQDRYKLLTRARYAYFWTIHNKYLPIEPLEYSGTIRI